MIALFDAYRIPLRQRARLLTDIRHIETGALLAHLEKREQEDNDGGQRV